MSYLIATPDALLAAASELTGVGSLVEVANAAAAVPTTGLLAAAGDEISAAIAAMFDSHAVEYQAVSAQAAAFQNRFLAALSAGAGSYALAEAAAASPFQQFIDFINAPTNFLFGRGAPGPHG
jgi:hypothetical protein